MPSLWRAVWRRLPLSLGTRYRIQARFPKLAQAVSRFREPPASYRRPLPRSSVPLERADVRAIGYRPRTSRSVASTRLVALYATPDWRAVARARPQFDGHAQPRLPEQGFYEAGAALTKQVELARAHGIHAFAFAPDGPVDQLCASTLELSFCLAGAADDPQLRRMLARARTDRRYLLIEGKPLVLVRGGFAHVQALRESGHFVVAEQQADATLTVDRALDHDVQRELVNPRFRGRLHDARKRSSISEWIVVSAGVDDEPLRPGEGRIDLYDSPRAYRDRLSAALKTRAPFVFVDAWNDWQRGAVLEPDMRLGYAYLAATQDALEPIARNSEPCAVVHVYYVELLDELVAALRGANCTRVVITTPPDRVDAVRARLLALRFAAEIEAHENRGRDLLPFLRVVNRLYDEGVELVVKLHTKSSQHHVDGNAWRDELVQRLLEPARVPKIIHALRTDPKLGCIAPEGHLLPLSAYRGWNEDNVRSLCARMGGPEPSPTRDRFVAGSMFWARTEALRPLLDAHLGEWEFEPEDGAIDGTMAHAIERAVSLAVQVAGFVTRSAAAVCGIPFDERAPYRYALRSA